MNRRIIVIISILGAVVVLLCWRINISNPHNSTTIGSLPLPCGYVRVEVPKDSYAAWLRNLPLKPKGTKTHLYNGRKSNFQWLSAGVIDLPLLSNDEQCADVCMRLYAEYLYERELYNKICFTDLNGKKLAYTGGNNRKAFERFIRQVFGCCNTTSLCQSLPLRELKDIQIGDMFIYPHRKVNGRNHYGHAVLVADIAVNTKTGKKAILLVEGNTPARDIHILRNFNPFRNPWFYLDEEAEHLRFNVFRFANNKLMYYGEP